MRQAHVLVSRGHRVARWALVFLGLLLALAVAPAQAAIERVASFADEGEGMQLEGSRGLAVNTTGAGGVPAGTVYATGTRDLVARYDPDGEFSEAWGWSVSAGGSDQFERCGPDGEAVHPACVEPPEAGGSEGEGIGRITEAFGIAVHQATGNVYVLNGAGSSRKHNLIEVFSADGSEVIARFGDAGAFAESFSEGPEKIHLAYPSSSIAVDESGVVYVTDQKIVTPESPDRESRVMIFKPQSPGDFEHYVYAGRENDIDAAGRLALDSVGNLYVGEEDNVRAYDLNAPAGPTCEFKLAAGGITALTVNPATGEPFYFSYKTNKIHQLSACNSEGKFVAKSTIAPAAENASIGGLAFNPSYVLSPSRPPGTLYAADEGSAEYVHGTGEIFAPAEAFPPSVESQAVSLVTPSTARLSAEINPKGFDTRYVFQYLTAAEYGANEPGDRFAGAREAPLGGGVLAGGQKAVTAAATVTGLEADTEYRYRVVATSRCEPDDETAVCEDTGSDATFRTFPAGTQGLPDNRAYELVSPALKSGGEVFPLSPAQASCGIECKPGADSEAFPRMSSPDGEAVVYEGQPFSLTEGANVYNQYRSERTPTGWRTTILAPRLMGSNLQGYRAFDAELTAGVLLQGSPSLTPSAPSETNNLYVQPTADPSDLTPLLGSEPPNRGQKVGLAYAGASADFSRHFFAADDALTGATAFAPEALDGGSNEMNLYESVGGELRLVNVAPGNAETTPGAHFGAPALTASNNTNSISNLFSAISEDGSRVFWSDDTGQVYVRENGETTTEVPDSGAFLSAAADGSKVLLRNGHLYDLEAETLTDLTAGEGGFEGILGQAENLSRIHFVATTVLTGEDENQYGAKAAAGGYNLYSWQEDGLSFVATLLAADNVGAADYGGGGDWGYSPAQRSASASPNGRWLAFLSQAPLTGYDNVGPTCRRDSVGALVTAPCREVFLYDSAIGELGCPSCNPSHAGPRGSSALPQIRQLGGREDPIAPSTYLTDEGRLYFDSLDSLTPFDSNGRVEDVYQYEPQGVGTCERVGGCVALISAGTGSVDSNFLAVDRTGRNVFFTTRDRLVAKDPDDLIDLYVAREGGGIPAETETINPECQGEACLPAVSPPSDPTPASATFAGAGNVDEKKASKKSKKKKKKLKKRGARKKAKSRSAKHNRGGNR